MTIINLCRLYLPWRTIYHWNYSDSGDPKFQWCADLNWLMHRSDDTREFVYVTVQR